eukprot:scaffold113_cov202-Chaetoceros_neogracile.AAC.2
MIYNYSTHIIYTCIRVLASLQASGLSKSPVASLGCSSKEELFKQVRLLEKAIYYPRDLPDQSAKQQEEVLRAHKAVIDLKIYSAIFKWVPAEYYNFSLSQRAEILGSHSTFQLCKSMLMENKAFDDSLSDENYSQFYLVILQYETSINNKKLKSEIRALRPVAKRLDPSKFDFRVANEADNARLTGYSHNAVTPFGLLEDVPIVLSKGITEYSNMTPFMWMGGGHKDCKVGMAAKDFIKAKSPFVIDVTDPR